MTNREQAEALVGEVHDPGQAALVYAVLALVDAVESLAAPGDPEDASPPFEQTKEGWRW